MTGLDQMEVQEAPEEEEQKDTKKRVLVVDEKLLQKCIPM